MESVPPALMHNIGGEGKAVMIEIEPIYTGEITSVKLNPKVEAIQKAVRKVTENENLLFLLNPGFYEFFEGYELGVVKPWQRE